MKNLFTTRWGAGTACKHGGFLNCKDKYNPGVKQTRKWENAMTLDKGSWGNRRNAKFENFLSPEVQNDIFYTNVDSG
jgi:alpha-L-fucosidase